MPDERKVYWAFFKWWHAQINIKIQYQNSIAKIKINFHIVFANSILL